MSDEKAKADCLADAISHSKSLDETPMIVICQGPPRCDYRGEGPPRPNCPYCCRIRADDPRGTDQIIAEMNKLHS